MDILSYLHDFLEALAPEPPQRLATSKTSHIESTSGVLTRGLNYATCGPARGSRLIIPRQLQWSEVVPKNTNLTDRAISLHTTYLLMLIYSEHLHRSNLRGIPQGRLEGVRGHATPGSGFMVGARKGPGIVSKLKTFRKTPIK